jgi:hypothetical protein
VYTICVDALISREVCQNSALSTSAKTWLLPCDHSKKSTAMSSTGFQLEEESGEWSHIYALVALRVHLLPLSLEETETRTL